MIDSTIFRAWGLTRCPFKLQLSCGDNPFGEVVDVVVVDVGVLKEFAGGQLNNDLGDPALELLTCLGHEYHKLTNGSKISYQQYFHIFSKTFQ